MALMANNSDTLAWIDGVSNQFTERGHLFFTNEVIAKTIVLHNDTRTNQAYTFSWVVTNNNIYGASGSGSGSAGPGTTSSYRSASPHLLRYLQKKPPAPFTSTPRSVLISIAMSCRSACFTRGKYIVFPPALSLFHHGHALQPLSVHVTHGSKHLSAFPYFSFAPLSRSRP